MDAIDLTPLLQALLSLAVLIITCYLIPFLKRRAGEEKWDEVQKWVQIAVYAAEMLYTGSGMGAEKKQYVMQFLTQKGYALDAEKLDAMIEAAVKELQIAVGVA
jgi:hypothetical protein